MRIEIKIHYNLKTRILAYKLKYEFIQGAMKVTNPSYKSPHSFVMNPFL